MRRTENISALGHEMHATENDVIGIGPSGGLLSELERIAAKIGILDDLITLIVMAQNDQPRAQRLFGSCNAPIQFLAIHLGIHLGNNISALCKIMLHARMWPEQR